MIEVRKGAHLEPRIALTCLGAALVAPRARGDTALSIGGCVHGDLTLVASHDGCIPGGLSEVSGVTGTTPRPRLDNEEKVMALGAVVCLSVCPGCDTF